MPSLRPLFRILLFAAILLLPLSAGESYIRSVPNPSKAKHAHMKAHSKEIDVLILGSSHTYYGIAPERISKRAYSLAQVSQTLRYDDFLLHHYPMPNLRMVVLPISDFSLYEELEDGKEWYLANRYRLYMDCNIHPHLSVYDWEITSFPTYCEKLKQLWQPPHMHWSAYGQGLEYTLAHRPTNWDNGEERAANNTYTDLSRATNGISHLESIARFCESNHVRLILLSTPLRPSYRQHQNADQLADTHSRIQQFLQRHPQTTYLDFRASPQFSANDFYDSDHLNTQGAQKLSLLVAQHTGWHNKP